MSDPWLACAVHVALQVQHAHQSQKAGKGRTFLIFDEQKQKADRLSELLFAPPSWTDDYYGRSEGDEPLSEIIDDPLFVKSHHVGLVQVADLLAYVIRRYAELEGHGAREKFSGEAAFVAKLVGIFRPRLLPSSSRRPKRSGGECASWYQDTAAEPLADF